MWLYMVCTCMYIYKLYIIHPESSTPYGYFMISIFDIGWCRLICLWATWGALEEGSVKNSGFRCLAIYQSSSKVIKPTKQVGFFLMSSFINLQNKLDQIRYRYYWWYCRKWFHLVFFVLRPAARFVGGARCSERYRRPQSFPVLRLFLSWKVWKMTNLGKLENDISKHI